MPDASIVVTMDDKYSDAVKKMSSVTKAFSKDVKQLENVLYALGKNKISLQIDLGNVTYRNGGPAFAPIPHLS